MNIKFISCLLLTAAWGSVTGMAMESNNPHDSNITHLQGNKTPEKIPLGSSSSQHEKRPPNQKEIYAGAKKNMLDNMLPLGSSGYPQNRIGKIDFNMLLNQIFKK